MSWAAFRAAEAASDRRELEAAIEREKAGEPAAFGERHMDWLMTQAKREVQLQQQRSTPGAVIVSRGGENVLLAPPDVASTPGDDGPTFALDPMVGIGIASLALGAIAAFGGRR